MVLDEGLDGSTAFVDARPVVIGGGAHLRSIGTAVHRAGDPATWADRRILPCQADPPPSAR